MRIPVASLSKKAISTFFAVTLAFGLVPASAFAAGDGSDDGSAARVVSTEGSGSELAEETPVAEGSQDGAAGIPSDPSVEDAVRDEEEGTEDDAEASGDEDPAAAVSAGDIINEEMPLDTVVAQAESTKSFFLAQTLESTRTIPVVSASLPVDASRGAVSTEGGDGERAGGVSAASTVVGSFEYLGMTFAMETGGESVALVAVDYSKLPEGFVEEQVIAVPDSASPDGIDSYGVARIADGAFSSLTEASANPEYTGCEALLSDDELLAEAGIDPDEAERLLADDDAADAAQDDRSADASSSMQAQVEASAYGDGSGSEPSSDGVRFIVSMDGDVAILDDGSTYEFGNPLAGCTGILAVGIPASVARIEDDAFSDSDTLQYIVVSDDNQTYASFDGALYSADLSQLRLIPEGRLGAVRIASSATDIDPEVFSHCPSVDTIVVDADGAASDRKGDCSCSEGISALLCMLVEKSETALADGCAPARSASPLEISSVSVYATGGSITAYGNGGTLTTCNHFTGEVLASGQTSRTMDGSGMVYATGIFHVWTSNGLEQVDPDSRPGYIFQGWSTSSTRTPITSDVAVSSNSTYVFYAIWQPVIIAIGNGGTLSTSLPQAGEVLDTGQTSRTMVGSGMVYANGTFHIWTSNGLEQVDSDSRPGYTFQGWSTSSTGTPITSDVLIQGGQGYVFYAIWNKDTYYITYDDGGGSFSGKTASYDIETADFELPSSGTRTGCTFAGWDVSGASGTGVTGNGTTSVTIKKGTYGDLTATAKWTKNAYHLSWDVPHGTHANRTSDFTVDDCPIAMSAAVPDEGYAFEGWSGTGITAGSESFSLTSAMLEGRGDGETFSYAASFSARSYAVRLHANDGTGAVSTVRATYDSPVDDVDVPKRYGYVFSGYWTKNADGGKGELYFDEKGAFARASAWNVASDADLYACWTLMADLEVPINAPGAVTLRVDRATEVGDDASGASTGESVEGALRSAVPQEVPIASIELEAIEDPDGVLAAERVLGAGNPERCGVEVSLGPSAKALLRLAGASSSMRWAPGPDAAPKIPAAVSTDAAGEGIVTDELGNLAKMGELDLVYAMRLLPGFDVYGMPAENATDEPVARIVFTVDLTGLEHEAF